jgi:hypothetical protein
MRKQDQSPLREVKKYKGLSVLQTWEVLTRRTTFYRCKSEENKYLKLFHRLLNETPLNALVIHIQIKCRQVNHLKCIIYIVLGFLVKYYEEHKVTHPCADDNSV